MVGEMNDDWLSFERFKPIAKECYEILLPFYNLDAQDECILEEWQVKLMNWFLLCSQQ